MGNALLGNLYTTKCDIKRIKGSSLLLTLLQVVFV